MKKVITIAAILFTGFIAKSQSVNIESVNLTKDNPLLVTEIEKFKQETDGGINFYIITKEKSKKIDLTSLSTNLRASIREFLDRKTLYVISAKSSEDAANKMIRILHRRKKMINNIWFDSHGHYGNRYSSFRVGKDIFSYKNINDSIATKYLKIIAAYCDENTKIGLGACYAGADFYFPATDSTAASRMNGDSLMIGLGMVFTKSSVYASESWVMAKPGIFANKYGFAGYPLQNRFLDNVYAPVWQRLGKWRHYSTLSGEIKNVSTVALNRWGDINFRTRNYNDLPKVKKTITEKTKKLMPGLAKFS